eukprot:Filipodium_phascolosomae@DN2436_c0_g1_i1.p1
MQRRRIFFCPVCVNLIEENRRLRSVLADLLVALEHSERTNKRVMLEQTKTLMDLDEVQASKAKLQSEVQKLDQWLYETKLMEQKLRLQQTGINSLGSLHKNIVRESSTPILRTDNNPPASAKPMPGTSFLVKHPDYSSLESPQGTVDIPSFGYSQSRTPLVSNKYMLVPY